MNIQNSCRHLDDSIVSAAFMAKKEAVPCDTAKFREETSKMQSAEAGLQEHNMAYGRLGASSFLHCSIFGLNVEHT